VEVVRLEQVPELAWAKIVFSKEVILVTVVVLLGAVYGISNLYTSPAVALITAFVVIAAVMAARASTGAKHAWHRVLEGRALIFSAFAAIAVLAGGIAEIVPVLMVKPAEIGAADGPKPYRALELEGRDLYVNEGCYTCHSQMIRPMTFETKRFGDPSTMA